MGTRHTTYFMDKEYPNIPIGGGAGGGGSVEFTRTALIETVMSSATDYALSDSIENYDYIEMWSVNAGHDSDEGEVRLFDAKGLKAFMDSNRTYTMSGFGSNYYNFKIVNGTTFRVVRINGLIVYKVFGIKIEGSGGGGGGSSYSETELFVNTTPTTMPPASITLDDDFTNYDVLYFDIIRGADGRAYHIGKELLVSTLVVGDSFQFLIYSGEYFSFTITDSTTLTRLNYGGDYLYKIIGIKH